MTPLLVALTCAALGILGCCTAVLVRYRKGRLVADSLHLLERAKSINVFASSFLPFVAPMWTMAPNELAKVTSLSLTEAEDLLDWLEQNGYADRVLLCESETSFAVEFRVHAESPAVEVRRSTA